MWIGHYTDFAKTKFKTIQWVSDECTYDETDLPRIVLDNCYWDITKVQNVVHMRQGSNGYEHRAVLSANVRNIEVDRKVEVLSSEFSHMEDRDVYRLVEEKDTVVLICSNPNSETDLLLPYSGEKIRRGEVDFLRIAGDPALIWEHHTSSLSRIALFENSTTWSLWKVDPDNYHNRSNREAPLFIFDKLLVISHNMEY